MRTPCGLRQGKARKASTSLVGGTAVCDEASLRTAIEASYSAEGAVTVTEVLEAEGQFWLVKNREAVCGTFSTDDPATRPDDAQVPADIWADACNTN